MSAPTPWSTGFENDEPRLITSYLQPAPVDISELDLTDGRATIELVRDSSLAHSGSMLTRHRAGPWPGSGSTIYCGLWQRGFWGEANFASEIYVQWHERFLNLPPVAKGASIFYFLGRTYTFHYSLIVGLQNSGGSVGVNVRPYMWPAAPERFTNLGIGTDRYYRFEAWERIGVNGELGVAVDGQTIYNWFGDTTPPTGKEPPTGFDVGVFNRLTETGFDFLLDDLYMGPIPATRRRVRVAANAYTGGRLVRVA